MLGGIYLTKSYVHTWMYQELEKNLMFFDRASWYVNEPTWYTFLSLFIKSQCFYMFRALTAHVQEAVKCTMYNVQYVFLMSIITARNYTK
jgi:hypothetical protein